MNQGNDLTRDILPDQNGDLFNFTPDAENLSGIIRNYNKPCIIAITGKWGSGKSTLLKYTIQNIRKYDCDSYFIYINAYRLSLFGNITIGLLDVIVGNILKLSKSKLRKVRRLASKCNRVFTEIPEYKITTSLIKSVFNRNIDTRMNIIGNLLKEISLITSDIYKERNIYLVIEDIDRCKPRDALEIIESTKLICQGQDDIEQEIGMRCGESGKITYHKIAMATIITLDDMYIANIIKNCYNLEPPDNQIYLSKFLDYKYEVPVNDFKFFIKEIASEISIMIDKKNQKLLEMIMEDIAKTISIISCNIIRENKRIFHGLVNKISAVKHAFKKYKNDPKYVAIIRCTLRLLLYKEGIKRIRADLYQLVHNICEYESIIIYSLAKSDKELNKSIAVFSKFYDRNNKKYEQEEIYGEVIKAIIKMISDIDPNLSKQENNRKTLKEILIPSLLIVNENTMTTYYDRLLASNLRNI